MIKRYSFSCSITKMVADLYLSEKTKIDEVMRERNGLVNLLRSFLRIELALILILLPYVA